jgi:D-methionine transport system permease protein
MSDYIRDAIVTGVWETFIMTFFSSLFSYIIGMP